MSKSFLGLLCLTFSLSSLLLKAQADLNKSTQAVKTPQTLLWKIEGEGIHTSYIYGTFHLLPEKDFVLKEKVQNAFNSSDQIILEVDMDDPQLQLKMMQNATMKDNVTLDQLFSLEQYKALDQLLQKLQGANISVFNTLKPSLLISLLLTNYIEGTPISLEYYFVELAKKQEKGIHGLETIEEQLAVFDKIPYQDQANNILEMLENEEETKKTFAEMIALYKSEDAKGIYDYTLDYFNNEQEKELLLKNRNEAWISKIGQFAKEKASFFGVGAAHLGGEEGVLNLLQLSGYTISPVL